MSVVLLAAAMLLPARAALAGPYDFTADDVGFSEGGETAGVQQRIAAMDEYLGAKKPILRIDLFWELIQTCRGCPVQWNAGGLDDRVNAAHEQGVRVLLILNYSPDWANGHPGENHWLPDDSEAWADIVAATVEHFGAKVQAYEVWNEPNYLTYGKFGDNSTLARATRYWELTEIAYTTIKARCAGCVVIAGASGGGDVDDTVSPIRNDNEAADWLQIAYAQGKGGFFDAVAYHPYPDMGGGHLPSFSKTTCTGTIWYRFWSAFGPDGDVNCGGLAALYDVMSRNGQGGKKIWATEFGYSTLGPRTPMAARYVRDALEEGVRSWRMRPYAGPLFIYSFQNPDPASAWCVAKPFECAFGLRDHAGVPREPMYSDVGAALRGDPWPSSLVTGRSLFRGAALRSDDGRYHLWMQGDGNLVLYDGSRVLWGRGGQKAYRLTNQDDGNLVLYDHTRDHTVTMGDAYTNPAIWASATRGPAATLRLQNDGNLVLYRGTQPVWDTATYSLKITSMLHGKCLDAGSGPRIVTCNGSAAQRWILSDERLMSHGNLCADTSPALRLSACTGGATQRWQVTANGSLLNPQSGRCLDIPNSNTADGVALRTYTCNGTNAQRWTRAVV